MDFAGVSYSPRMFFNRFALTTVRELRGLTKSDLARGAGKSAAYVTQLEKGDRTSPSLPALTEMAAALEVDARVLYTQPTVSEILDELVERLHNDTAAFDESIRWLLARRESITRAAS